MQSVPHFKQIMRRRRRMLAGGYSSKVLGTGPIAYWPLNEVSGTVAACRINSAQNGTYERDVSVMSTGIGPDGNSAPLFGTNDAVDIQTATFAAAFSGNPGSWMVWAQGDVGAWTDGATRIMLRIEADANNYTQMGKTAVNNTARFHYRAGGTNEVTDVVVAAAPSGWYCFIGTFVRPGDFLQYQNGGEVATDAIAGVWAGAPAVSLIGAQSVGPITNGWDGYLAHVAVWDYVLPPSTVASLASP